MHIPQECLKDKYKHCNLDHICIAPEARAKRQNACDGAQPTASPCDEAPPTTSPCDEAPPTASPCDKAPGFLFDWGFASGK